MGREWMDGPDRLVAVCAVCVVCDGQDREERKSGGQR